MKTGPLMQRFQVSRVAVLCFLLVLVAIGAVPGYWTGHWHWAQPPQVTNLKRVKSLLKKPVTLPGWQTKEQRPEKIGGHKWSYQELHRDDEKPVILLLLPQKDDKAQPEVEWMDIKGFQGWQTDSDRQLQFTVEASLTAPRRQASRVEARFFRAWNLRQTFAVLQWYAWPGGGNPAPSQWFLADQLAQWHRRRVPWVAVSLHIPIQPLGNIETAQALAQSLGQMVQAALMADYLSISDL